MPNGSRSSTAWIWTFAGTSLLLIALAPALAQQVSVTVTPKSPLVAEVTRVEVKVIGSKSAVVELPDSLRLDCAAVTQASDSPPRAASGGRVEYRRTFVLELNGPGVCRIPPVSFLYGEAQLSTPEVAFTIRSAIAPEEGPDPDIRDRMPLIPFRQAAAAPWRVISTVTLVLAALAGIIWFAQHRAKAPPESPEARARRRLAELSAAVPAARVEFCEALSGILAQYADERFRLRARRCTSTEILERLQRMHVVTHECQTALSALLADCD